MIWVAKPSVEPTGRGIRPDEERVGKASASAEAAKLLGKPTAMNRLCLTHYILT